MSDKEEAIRLLSDTEWVSHSGAERLRELLPGIREIEDRNWELWVAIVKLRLHAQAWTRRPEISLDAITTPEFCCDATERSLPLLVEAILETIKDYEEGRVPPAIG